ncbi:MAG TPA: RNase P subunit p30 family protein [candidate division Zixibacteria bacterium]|nr:RNase P subunit p30 family protein [candidate division Zixibacteria bacterium]
MIPFFEPLVMIENSEDLAKFDEIAKRLGLKGFVILGEKYSEKKNSKSPIEHISRLEIAQDQVNTVRATLPNLRLQCELLSIRTANEKVAQWVVKDNRVDILSIQSNKMKEIITIQLANVAAANETFFEIDLSPLIKKSNKKSIYIRTITRIMNIISIEKAPFIFTIQAKSPYDLRDQRTMMALAKLVGVSEKQFKESQKAFFERIKKNVEKLSEDFVVPGVKKAVTKEKDESVSSYEEEKINDYELSIDLVNVPINEKKMERQRYLLFEILSEKPIEITQKQFEEYLWESFTNLFGSVGSSRAGLFIIKFNPEKNYGILRCSHLALNALRASLATINQINDIKVIIHIMKVSGTIKSLESISIKKKRK